MAQLTEIMDALAAQIQNQLCSGTADPLIENLQVHGRMNPNPSPPAVDVYPADPFQEPFTFGGGNNIMFFTVRARVSVADQDAGQDLLLSLMDPKEETSMIQAILSDRTLGGKAAKASVVAGPSAYGVFVNPAGEPGSLLGCTWTVQVTA